MHIHTRNVNTSFKTFVSMLHTGEYQSEDGCRSRLAGSKIPMVRRPSRNGDVLMIDEPVTITYSHPLERVLMNSARDANPFFHLYHSLWMLAGRNDVASLAYFVKNMVRYSDDGEILNGAYGHRWRKAVTHQQAYDNAVDDRQDYTDQLKILVNHLKADPNSRRAVLTMWNVEDDLPKLGTNDKHPVIDLERASKDVCCNVNVMFSTRDGWVDDSDAHAAMVEVMEGPPRYLDVTVTNRSNDLVWGMLGEDYCTFTFLQEYVAAQLGVEVGRYHHFTNNLHVYESNWEPTKWLTEDENQYEYPVSSFKSVSLIKDVTRFDAELADFVQLNGDGTKTVIRPRDWSEPFLEMVAQPMINVIHARKRGEPADKWIGKIEADDWRHAAETWLKSSNRGKRS